MNWFTQPFGQYTVAWLLVSSFVGGVIGASVRFLFEDVLRPRLGWHREAEQIVRRYTTPIVRAADSLERRINILVRNEKEHWFENDEYFRMSSLYQFGVLLGWIRILERKFGFLPFESSRRGSQFNSRVNGIFRALSSHAYFHTWIADVASVDASLVPRLMFSAIGEAMTAEADEANVLDFTEFVASYANEPRFRRWFLELEIFLAAAHPIDSLRWDRLIASAASLRALVRFLDPKGTMVRKRPIANLDKLRHPEIRSQLEQEFANLIAIPQPNAPRRVVR